MTNDNNEVEELANHLKEVEYGNLMKEESLAKVILSWCYIHKSKAVDYCEVCSYCYGGYKPGIGPARCPNCAGEGIVLRKNK